MSRKEAQSDLYDLQVQAYKDALEDQELSASDKIKLLESLRNFLKDNGTTSAAVEEKLQGIVQGRIENGEMPDYEDDDDEDFRPELRAVGG